MKTKQAMIAKLVKSKGKRRTVERCEGICEAY